MGTRLWTNKYNDAIPESLRRTLIKILNNWFKAAPMSVKLTQQFLPVYTLAIQGDNQSLVDAYVIARAWGMKKSGDFERTIVAF